MLDDWITEDRGDDIHMRFLKALADGTVKYDIGNGARSYVVGDSIRVWVTHAGSDWAGINRNRRDKFQEDEHQLVHLLIRHSEESFRTRIEDRSDDVEQAAGSMDWYVVDDESLNQFVDAPASGQYHLSDGFDLLGTFYHDGRRLLEVK